RLCRLFRPPLLFFRLRWWSGHGRLRSRPLPLPLVMLPPLEIVSMPFAFAFTPMVTAPSWDQVEPDPSTSTVLVSPDFEATTASMSETVPPLVTLSVPLPFSPTFSEPPSARVPLPDTDKVPTCPASTPSSTRLAAAPLAMICAVPPLFICAAVLESGTPADQLAEVNQSPVASVQTVVCANAGTEVTNRENNAQRATDKCAASN